MIRILDRVAAILCLCVTIALGIFLVLFAFNLKELRVSGMGLAEATASSTLRLAAVAVVGALLIAIGAMKIIGWVASKRRARHVSLAGPLGEIQISASTIESFISRASDVITEVKKITPTVTTSRDGRRIKIQARISVQGARDLKETCEKLQTFVAESVKRVLGIEDIEEVSVSVREVIPSNEPVSPVEPRFPS